MYYCYMIKKGLFDEEMAYAKDLDRYLFYDKNLDVFVDKDDQIVNIKDKNILVRSGVFEYPKLLEAVISHGGNSITKVDDYELVNNWPNYIKTKRKVMLLKGSEIINNPSIIKDNFDDIQVFFKTKIKNYSGIVNISKFYELNNGFYKALCEHKDDDFIVSDVLDIKTDASGELEYRAFIIDGQIMNISRRHDYLICQNPEEIVAKAKEVVRDLSNTEFPKSYVLDLFVTNDGIDVLECNPIEGSGYYLYNSIFDATDDLIHTDPVLTIPKFQRLYGKRELFSHDASPSGVPSICYELPGGFAADIITFSLIDRPSNGTYIHLYNSKMPHLFGDFIPLTSDNDMNLVRKKDV